MADPITQPGGLRPANDDEQVTRDFLNDMQTMGLSATFNLLLARLLKDVAGGAYDSGFFGDDCKAEKGAGSLDVDVAAGFGVFYDTTESDPHELIYKPIVVRAAFTQALSAHDPADPRIDIICLAPARDDDESATVYIYGGGTASKNTRRRLGCAVQVVEGTPASSPATPSTPTGYIKIAECAVPAASGDVVVTDTRIPLRLTRDLAGPPGGNYHHNWVPGSSSELAVTSGSYPNVSIAAGQADINGREYDYAAQSEAMTTSDGTYYVFAKADGTITHGLVSGYASRAAAEAAEEAAVLATVVVSTGGGTTTVTDARYRAPFDGDSHIEDDSVGGAKLSFNFIQADLTVNAEASDQINIDLVTQNMDGDAVSPPAPDGFLYLVEIYTSTMAIEDSGDFSLFEDGSGSMVHPSIPSPTGRAVLETDGSGELTIGIGDNTTTSTDTLVVAVTPWNFPGPTVKAIVTFS